MHEALTRASWQVDFSSPVGSAWKGLSKYFDLSELSRVKTIMEYFTGFPQALEIMENPTKKFHAWKNHGIWKKPE